MGFVIAKPGIRPGDDAAIESEQRGDDLEGRTGREAFLRKLPVSGARIREVLEADSAENRKSSGK